MNAKDWKLVPVEPTEEWVENLMRATNKTNYHWVAERIKEVLAASPAAASAAPTKLVCRHCGKTPQHIGWCSECGYNRQYVEAAPAAASAEGETTTHDALSALRYWFAKPTEDFDVGCVKAALNLGSAEIVRSAARIAELTTGLNEANEICRTAWQIASRAGLQTNWDAFRERLEEALDDQAATLAPAALAIPSTDRGG